MKAHRESFFIPQTAIRSKDKFSILVIVDSVEGIERCIQFFKRYRLKENRYSPVYLALLVDPQLTIQQVRDFLTEMEQWAVDKVSLNITQCQQFVDSANLVLNFHTDYEGMGKWPWLQSFVSPILN